MKRIQTQYVPESLAAGWEKMRLKIPMDIRDADSTTLAGLGLSLIALVLLVAGLLSGRSDLPTGLLVVIALICFLASAALIALGGGRGVPRGCVATLEQGEQISLCRICSDLGCDGNAHLIHSRNNESQSRTDSADTTMPLSTETGLWQFNPARSEGQILAEGHAHSGKKTPVFFDILKHDLVPSMDRSDGTAPVFQSGGPVQGLFTVPAGAALLSYLRISHGLQIPGIISHSEDSDETEEAQARDLRLDVDAFSEILTEVYSEILGCAERVTVSLEGDGALVVHITGFTLFGKCKAVTEESQNICSMMPCTFCSLPGCIVSSATDQVWKLSHVRLLPEERGVIAVWQSPETGTV